jgi:hypothetical protein
MLRGEGGVGASRRLYRRIYPENCMRIVEAVLSEPCTPCLRNNISAWGTISSVRRNMSINTYHTQQQSASHTNTNRDPLLRFSAEMVPSKAAMYDVLLKNKLTKLDAPLQSNIRMSYQQYWEKEELSFPSNLNKQPTGLYSTP